MTTADCANWTTEFFAWADENHISAEKLPRDEETLLSQTALNLSFCKLTQLPESLANLTHLTELDLAYNELTQIPEWIDNFTALEKLDVSGNSITSLPDSLRHLPNLVVLGLDKQIKTGEKMAQKSNLPLLQLRQKQQIETSLLPLPKNTAFLDKLIMWADNHSIRRGVFPRNPKELYTKTVLNLNKANLKKIPEEIGMLANLTSLDLSYNKLSEIPESIVNLSNLSRLNVANNLLTTLPKFFCKFSKLHYLNLDDNPFVEVPEWIGDLIALKQLSLANHKLTKIPEWIGRLTNLNFLNLDDNELTELPEFISTLTNLNCLNLSLNRLIKIPDSILNMPNLEIVGLNKQFPEELHSSPLQILVEKQNMKTYQQKILFGSPGTGKSWRIDKIIIPSLDIKDSKNIIKTVFHPEYTYGDFVGKLMPITNDKNAVEYNFYEGHFLKALSQAYKNIIAAHDKHGNRIDDVKIENVVLVIDEINRGNSAAIFGTIFQLLDREADGWSSYEVSVNKITFTRLLGLCNLKPHTTGQYEIANGDIVEPAILQKKLKCDFKSHTIKIPFNLSILASMNTSDSSIYYMDSAFKRRWEWEFIDVDSNTVSAEGVAFENRDEWIKFVSKLNAFIKSNHKSIRGIEDKQIGHFFITDEQILKSSIQNKLMFFLWDSVFNRDKKPLVKLLFDENTENELITFGDFAKEVDLFIQKISEI